MPHPATEMGRMLQPRGTVAVATSAVVAAAVNAPLMHPPATPLRLHLSLSQAADSRANGWLLGPVPIRVPSGNPRPLVCQMPRLLCRWVLCAPPHWAMSMSRLDWVPFCAWHPWHPLGPAAAQPVILPTPFGQRQPPSHNPPPNRPTFGLINGSPGSCFSLCLPGLQSSSTGVLWCSVLCFRLAKQGNESLSDCYYTYIYYIYNKVISR